MEKMTNEFLATLAPSEKVIVLHGLKWGGVICVCIVYQT